MVVTVDPPKNLSTDLVMKTLAIYKSSRSSQIHDQVKGEAFTFKIKEKIATLIQDALLRR
jgi:hypothetical protein